MYVKKKKTVMEYFEKPVKSVGRGLFIKKIEIFVRKSLVKIVTFFNIFFVANRKNVRQHRKKGDKCLPDINFFF